MLTAMHKRQKKLRILETVPANFRLGLMLISYKYMDAQVGVVIVQARQRMKMWNVSFALSLCVSQACMYLLPGIVHFTGAVEVGVL